MLGAEHVDARRKGKELVLRELEPRAREEGIALAEQVLDAARAHVGRSRAELEAAWTEITNDAPHAKLAGGLVKLATDGCTFEADDDVDAPEIRRVVFERAQAARLALPVGTPFDRARVLAEAGAALGLSADATERALFADLKGAHALVSAPAVGARGLVDAWELGQAQAVLLRATRVACTIAHASPGPLRAFFAKLKFRRLLFTAERTGEGAYRLVVDGPASMFEAGTRYGVGFAALVPALRELGTFTLEADVRWGKERTPLVFRLAGTERGASPAEPGRRAAPDVHLSDEAAGLLAALRAKPGPFAIRPADGTLLDVPGLGVCVPDLVVTRAGHAPVYVEVLGFWSRDAVFARVELAARGLGAPVVFVASAKLRVSEELLEGHDLAALYVHKGTPRASEVLARVERVMPLEPSSDATPRARRPKKSAP